MHNRIHWKSVFKLFAWLISLAGVMVLMSFINTKRNALKCSKVQILIPGADNFVEREEINAILAQGQGELVGRNLENINIHQIERDIRSNPYIAFVKVYHDMDGVIYVKIRQRQPILRIINAGGQDYYIDSKGLKMPTSPNFTANVLVATGNISEAFGGRVDTLYTALAKDLYKVALYAKKDTLWDAQFEQLNVSQGQDIELVPRVGNQRIILGNADSLQTKLDNLLAFYKQAMPKVGWSAYKTISLKYANQIVCTRYDSLELKRLQAKMPVMFNDIMAAHEQAVGALVADAIAGETAKSNSSGEQKTPPAVKTAEKTEHKPLNAEVQKPVAKSVDKKPSTSVAAATALRPAEAKPKESEKKEKPISGKTKTFAEKMAERMKAGEKTLEATTSKKTEKRINSKTHHKI